MDTSGRNDVTWKKTVLFLLTNAKLSDTIQLGYAKPNKSRGNVICILLIPQNDGMSRF